MMHSDQIYIDTQIAREMLCEQFPQFRHEKVDEIHGSGTVNAIFKIGSIATARFPLRGTDPAACFTNLSDEARNMAKFAKYSTVAAPHPIGMGKPGPLYPMPWTVQSWVEGDVATSEILASSATFAVDIADLIAALRLTDTNGLCFDGQGRGGCLRQHDDWMSVCFANSEGLLDVPKLRRKWAMFRDLPSSGSDVMCHKDLIPSNLLIRGERLIGVLDSGSFGPADRSLDLVVVWHVFSRRQRKIVRTCLGSDTVEWKRGAAWAFQQAMGLVWYYKNSNEVMSELGRSTLSRILNDPDI